MKLESKYKKKYARRLIHASLIEICRLQNGGHFVPVFRIQTVQASLLRSITANVVQGKNIHHTIRLTDLPVPAAVLVSPV